MLESLRRMRALMAGMVIAFAISLLVENAVYRTFPPAEGFATGEPGALATYLAKLPQAGFWMMVGGWALSAMVGGLIACLIGRQELLRLVGVVTFAVLAGAITQFVLSDYPSWVMVSAVFATLFGGLGAYSLAVRLGLDRKKEEPVRTSRSR